MGISESEWRTFRQLHTVALDRYCKRVLHELDRIRADASRSHHERYLAVFELMREQDLRLASAFNDPSRSKALSQLAQIHDLGLLQPEELARFSQETRDVVDSGAHRFGS